MIASSLRQASPYMQSISIRMGCNNSEGNFKEKAVCRHIEMKMSVFLLATFYAVMAGAAFVIELLFQALHLVLAERNAQVLEAGIIPNIQ